MINEEKVILMTKAALYEEKERKRKLNIVKYAQYDYISLQVLSGWIFATISFFLCLLLWGACKMEYLMDNLHKMDLKSFGFTLLLIYLCIILAYSCILVGVSVYRYHNAKKSVGHYLQILRKISNIYVYDEKGTSRDSSDRGGRK